MGRDDLTQDEMEKIEENKMEENRFRKDLSKLLAGDKALASKPLLVGKTPNAIDCCIDSQGLDLVIAKRTILKCMSEEIRDKNGKQIKKSGHGLTEQQINDVMWAVKRPVMILQGSQTESLAVMTDIKDNENRYIFVFITINQDGTTACVNMIASVYGRNNLNEYLKKCTANGMILAINTEKVDELRLSIGGHFSEATALINFDSTIAYSVKSVKRKEKESWK